MAEFKVESRVIPLVPYTTLDEYVAAGGGKGLEAARAVAAETVIEELVASGLRGRGGAGFPTGVKWRTIKSFESPLLKTAVVVNAAEGEPGTYKDRTIIQTNPYAIIEGALIAAHAMNATSIVVATKAEFKQEVDRLRGAIAEVAAAGWCGDVAIEVAEGPSEYLYGEETALLEVIDGRPPFPRIAPPYRRGIDEVVESTADVESGSGLPANVHMAASDESSAAPPVLVNNVETMANVPAIIARGAKWFREVGTAESPGTIVCTVTGSVQRPCVVETAMGTPLRDLIDRAGGAWPDHELSAVLVGVSSVVLTPDQLDTELSYEAMAGIGSGLGSAGFMVVADDTAPISIVAGASRFLAVESCGQCTPCKQDGAEIATLLAGAARGEANPEDLDTIRMRLGTITTGARCSLAAQHQEVVGSLLDAFDAQIRSQFQPESTPVEITLVAALEELDAEGARFDRSFADKQLDWSHGAQDSGKTPVDLLTDHRLAESGLAATDDG